MARVDEPKRLRPPSLASFMTGTGISQLAGMDGGNPIRMGGPQRSPSTPKKKGAFGGLGEFLSGPQGGKLMNSLGDAMLMYGMMSAGGDPAETMSGILGRRDQLNANKAEGARYQQEQDYQRERDTTADKQWQSDYELNTKTQADKVASDERGAQADEMKRIDAARKDAQAQGNWQAEHQLALLQATMEATNVSRDNAREDQKIADEKAARAASVEYASNLLISMGLPPLPGYQAGQGQGLAPPMPGQGRGLAPIVSLPSPQPASASAAEAPMPQQAAMAAPPQGAAPGGMAPSVGQGFALMAADDPNKAMSTLGRLQMEGQLDPKAEKAGPQETAFQTKFGELLVKDFETTQNNGREAQVAVQQYGLMGAALGETYSGAGGTAILKLKRIAMSLGYNVEGVPEAEMAQKISRELALKLRNPQGGAGMPGALSDADRVFLESMVPGLENSRPGNALMTEYMVRLSQHTVKEAQFQQQYLMEHGGQLDTGWYQARAEFANANPIFTEEDRRKASALGTVTPVSTGSKGGGRTGGVDYKSKYGLE